MDRQLALVATVLCLAVASGCNRGGDASDSSSPEAVSADIERARAYESPAPQPIVGEQPRVRPSPPTVRWMSPERWLALQAAAAWSGKRDKPRPVVPLAPRDPSPSVEAPTEGEVSASDAPEVATETAEVVTTATTSTASADGTPAAESEQVTKEDEVASEDSSNVDEELRNNEAAMLGAGRGYTGVGAGDAGYTGIGAGPGFTGVGAGNGFTGIGAGPGFTGMLASISSEETASTRSMWVSLEGKGSAQEHATKAGSPMPIVVVWPVLIGPWGPSPRARGGLGR